jgi:hypothetical protein
MLKFALLIAIFSFPALSHELVWKKSDHKEIELKLNKNPIYKTQRLRRNQRVERNNLGTAISPYFIKDKTYYRFFEKISVCYKLTIKETVSFLSKARCPLNFSDIYIKVDNKIAKRFKTTKEAPKNITINKENSEFNFTAHVHSYRLIEDFTQLGKYPTQEITVSSLESFNVINQKGHIQIMNSVELERSKLGFLTPKVETTKQTIKFDQFNKRDFIFKDDQNIFYFYKRYQPKPFTFGLLKTSNKFKDYISNLENLFYPFNGINRCFRNDWIEPSQFDCDTLIFDKVSVGAYYKMSLIKVNYIDKSYELIE